MYFIWIKLPKQAVSEHGDGTSDSAYELQRKAKIRANKIVQMAILSQVI